MIERDVLVRLQSKALNHTLLRKPLIVRMQMIAADIRRLKEPQRTRESAADVLILIEHVERVPIALHLDIARRTGSIFTWKNHRVALHRALLRRALHRLPQHRPMIVRTPREIHTADAIPSAAELLVRVHQPYTRSLAQVLRHATHIRLRSVLI